jgi:hypothetical protein
MASGRWLTSTGSEIFCCYPCRLLLVSLLPRKTSCPRKQARAFDGQPQGTGPLRVAGGGKKREVIGRNHTTAGLDQQISNSC